MNGSLKLHERETSDLWQSIAGLRRTAIADKVFERPVTKAGRIVPGLEDEDADGKPVKKARPVPIRGSGGQQALGIESGRQQGSPIDGTVQSPSILSQLFGGAPSRTSSQDSRTIAAADERYAALEAKLDKIEEMVSRLVSGGLSLDNDDR
jgi:hypothetical protein